MKPFSKEWIRYMTELRRSNATVPVPSGKWYRRKSRSKRRDQE